MDSNSCVAEITVSLLLYGFFNPKEFSALHDVNARRIKRYISIIRNILSDMQLYM